MRTNHLPALVTIVIAAVFLVSMPVLAEDLRFRTDPPQRVDVPFRIFRTENMWNQLLLDTRTGQVWQLAFTVDSDGLRAKIPVSLTQRVSDKDATIGRFTLYPTDNMWTFLLLDQIDGRSWQCQFSTKLGQQGCAAILPPKVE
jgi:hypothetical protein